jgi:tRNA threonylcarbamoyl adenosine modification protein YeaZ
MRLLAIDTAFEACSVGVVDGPPILVSEVIGRGHAERLFGMIESAMEDAGLVFAELDRIAVTVGPGSFTGLRVGIAAARGLALVIGCPAVGIGTLSVHAERARALVGAKPVLTVLDARRDELYGQSFGPGGDPLTEPQVGDAASFAARWMPGVVLAGSGADLVAGAIGGTVEIAHRESAPDIAAMVRLELRAPPSSAAPRPLYLRPPDAKPQADKRMARL